jgi:hypothetical protein
MSEHSWILFDQLSYILLETHDNLLPDIDVEVDLDRLFRRTHLDASSEAGQGRGPDKGPIETHSRQYRSFHGTVSLSWG